MQHESLGSFIIKRLSSIVIDAGAPSAGGENQKNFQSRSPLEIIIRSMLLSMQYLTSPYVLPFHSLHAFFSLRFGVAAFFFRGASCFIHGAHYMNKLFPFAPRLGCAALFSEKKEPSSEIWATSSQHWLLLSSHFHPKNKTQKTWSANDLMVFASTARLKWPSIE